MSIQVKASDEKFTPFYLNGKWWTLITFATTRGFVVEKKSQYTQLNFTDWRYLSLSYFLDSANDGFTIENYPTYLSLDSSLYETEVPEGIPGREIADIDGQTVTIKKWSEWGSSDHITLIDGTKGIPLVNNHVALKNTEVINLNSLTGYTIVDQDEYKTMIPEVSNDVV